MASKNIIQKEMDELQAAFEQHRSAIVTNQTVGEKTRRGHLERLSEVLERFEDDIVKAVSKDFGHRSHMETLFGEVVATTGAVNVAKKYVGQWMRRRKVKTPLHMKPGHSYIMPQPLGVVGIISPWNYPFFLSLSPLAPALAAGNRVMIKPSELTPHSSELLDKMIRWAFPDGEVTVHLGDQQVGETFSSLPFDHLLFTGSTGIGRKIAIAAAHNLTPVTLELGGKSPAIIDSSAHLEKTCRSIVFGKSFNSGQTCVAPDYILVPKDQMPNVVDYLQAAFEEMYPDIDSTADYSAIITEMHLDRLKNLVNQAQEKGIKTISLGNQKSLSAKGKMALTLVLNPDRNLGVMQEEIFGPILPVISYDTIEEAIDYVNTGDRPLALYWFGADKTRKNIVLENTIAGGVTINDTNWHVVQENLPFGGVGASGQGAYHGESGFETFSHMKPVFEQSRFTNTKIMHPPYSDKTERVLNLLRKFI